MIFRNILVTSSKGLRMAGRRTPRLFDYLLLGLNRAAAQHKRALNDQKKSGPEADKS